ncbi:oligosaccharide flippase family protein [Mucilaginibacter sp. FT3.2]|uniref:oligosaccharide flippase family protein n=1 Tax=Mucilaginibacter sp. FT3.2 TaxID=2723090 RepID=UPI00162231D0|nr:oligosaccharide flippase family protein [Mucilaginibacter sp. FT3.2]MBB6234447.1 O-antigen/teichoic acid export membrane protein [Mucilaginibacter sp. FT3.2]
MSTAKKFAGQTAIYGISTVVSKVLSFILTPIYTKAYVPKVYGIFTTMFSWVSILNPLLAFGMETTFFRYLNKTEDKKQEVYDNAFATVLTLSLVFLLFALPFVGNIATGISIGNSNTHADYMLYVRYFIAVLVLDGIAVIPFAKMRADGRPGRYGILKFINVAIFVSCNLTFIYVFPFILKRNYWGATFISSWFRPGWVGYVFLSNFISSALTLLMVLPELLTFKFKFNWVLLKQMMMYSWPIMVANISYSLNENVDKLLLGKLLPAKESDTAVGIYSGCAKISLFLSIFVQAFRLGAEPFFFSHSKNKNAGQTYARIMDYFVIAVCVIFVALIANIELLKYFVNNHSYWVGLGVVPPLVFGYVSLGIYMNLSVWYRLSDQTQYGLYISGIGAVLTVVLNVIFIPKYSYMASAWISLAAYASMMVLSYIWGQKNYPIPYNIKKNIAYIVASIILVYLSFTIFKRNIFLGNALLLLFAGTAFYLERKSLVAILKG